MFLWSVFFVAPACMFVYLVLQAELTMVGSHQAEGYQSMDEVGTRYLGNVEFFSLLARSALNEFDTVNTTVLRHYC